MSDTKHMINVIVTNSLSQALNLPPEIFREFEETLRFVDQTVEFSYRGNLKRMQRLNDLIADPRFPKDRKEALQQELRQCLHINRGLEAKMYRPLFDSEGYFPTGLLTRALEILNRRQVKYEIQDRRKKPERKYQFLLKEQLPQLRYYQKAAARELEARHRGIVVMPTGTGKTKTACRMIHDLGVKTLVVTPGKEIVKLMMDDLERFFGKGKVKRLTTKDSKTKEINVVNIQALVKLDPAVFADIDMVIIDEFHHAAADTYLIANEAHLASCYYRIGLTATNFRNDGADIALNAVLSEVLYEYEIKTAISDGYLMKPEFRIIDHLPHQADSYQEAYRDCIVNNVERNAHIVDLVKQHPKDSVIILVKQIDHGEILTGMIPGSQFIHGESKEADREKMLTAFRKGELKCLIGTTVIGEGVDLPCANVLIMAASGKARSQIMQNIGRVLRILEGKKQPLVYDFTDRDGSWLEEHSLLRKNIYNQY